ncbi:hypothetical protein FOY51_11575 [Antrihabitans cavernicola]|uniref:Peptidase MA-like domain-containing protein n=1 Tax=Antrihabitans cavernicola TaxID=2495913 RepID=A0A5A7SB99_9NOCA|nr:hypothetical protein FOY51_11575 [Spelaeibacter cavernicola]
MALGVYLVRPQESDDAGAAPSSSAAPVGNVYEDQRRAGVQRLLDRWAAAIRSGNTAALTQLVDPRAAPEFLEAEVRRAQNLSGVPISDWGFEIGDEPDVTIAPDVADRLGASDVWAPPVYLRYAIAGPDAAPTRKPVGLTVARHGDDWKLVSDTDEPTRPTWRGPWDFAPMIAVTVPTGNGKSSVVLGHPEQRAQVDKLAAEVRDAVPAVTSLWGPNWAQSVLVIATSSHDEFVDLAGSDHSGSEVAAVAVSDAVAPGATTATGQRVVFSPDAAERLTDATRRSVLRHEMTHVATRASTVDGSPMWMLEGFADYSGYRNSGIPFQQIAPEVTQFARANGPPNSLPADSAFGADDDRAKIAYELGWSACAYIAATFGEPKLVELYKRLAKGPVDDAGVDAAMRDVIQLGKTDFVARWGGWVATQVR